MQGFMEACHEVPEKKLDLILHSPGGSLEAAESIVNYLRARFEEIRVFIPHAAMSAATMIACAADEIVMGEHSSVGPTDPQFILNTALGKRVVPAQAIIDQFEIAKKECQNPKLLAAWLPMLSQYGPDLLVQCANASTLSHDLVQEWLGKYMFKGVQDGKEKAKAIADWLADHNSFKSHGRHIARQELESKGVKMRHLEKDVKEQDNILSIFHAMNHAFSRTGSVKIIENHKGNMWVVQIQKVLMAQAVPGQMQPWGGGGPLVPQPPFKKKIIGER